MRERTKLQVNVERTENLVVRIEKVAPEMKGEINGKFRRFGVLPSNRTACTVAQGKEVVFVHLFVQL